MTNWKYFKGGNQFRTTFEPNFSSCLYELINFAKPFSNRIVRYKTGFSLLDHYMNSYEILLSHSKIKTIAPSCVNCVWIVEMKSKSKQHMVKLEDILVCTDGEWLSSGHEKLPVCIWEVFWIQWLRKFPNISIRPRGRDIFVDCFIFPNWFKLNTGTLKT